MLEEGRYVAIKFTCLSKIIPEDGMEVQGFRSFVKMNKQKFKPVDNNVSGFEIGYNFNLHRSECIFPQFIHANEY